MTYSHQEDPVQKFFEVWSVSGGVVRSFISEHSTWMEAHDKIMTLAHTVNLSFTVIDNRNGQLKRPPSMVGRIIGGKK